MSVPSIAVAASASEDSPAERIGEAVARDFAVVWRFLRRLGVPESHADDAAQAVFARVLARAELIRPGSERAYLMKAAFHISFEYRRAQKRATQRAAPVELDELSSHSPSPDDELARQQDRALLDAALERLPPELRAVLTLFELEGLSFSEIAEVLELPRGTVASRVRRAREQFTEAVLRLNRAKPGDRPATGGDKR